MSKATVGRLGALSLIWGSVFLWIKIAGYAFSPVQMVLARLVLGAVVLVAVGYARGLRLPTDRKIWFHLTVAALIGNAVPWVLYAQGERHGSSSIAAVVNGTAPVWTLCATLVLAQGTRIGWAKIAGAVLGLSGTVLVAAPWSSSGATPRMSILCFLLGSISFGSSFAYMGKFLAGRGIPPLMLAGGQLSAASVLLLLVTPFMGLSPIHFKTESVVALIVLGVICTGLAALLNFELVLKDGSAVASTVTYLMTVVAVILGAAVLNEPMGWTVAVGALAVLGATALLRRQPKAKPAPAVEPEQPAGVTAAGVAAAAE